MNSLPFSHLNLRRNPFGEFSADDRIAMACVDLAPAIAHLDAERAGGRAAVVQVLGDKGFGKTTHLLLLSAHYKNSAYVYIAEDERGRIPETGEPLLVDEAQRLTMLQRIRLFRSQRTLVLGTHRDFTAQLERAGRKVLSLAAERHTTPERIFMILNTRIQAVRRNEGPTPSVSMATVMRLHKQFGPDLRSLQHSLYEIFQKLGSVQDV